MTSLNSKRVVVMGLGLFGGGSGVTRFLVEQGARVLVTDLQPADKLTESLKLIEDLVVQLRLGEHRVEDFQHTDLIVANPAVKPHCNIYLKAARDAGVAITSEIRLLVQRLPNRNRTIGVTGTAGKSTVTAMIGHLLGKESTAWVGGNIGGSLLNSLNDIGENDWVVLELSSFMLENLREQNWSPHVAVVTNISDNHLDWHGSVQAYRDAKQGILAHQESSDIAILGKDVADWPTAPGVKRHVVDDSGDDLPLLIPGRHNQINAQMALRVCEIICSEDSDRSQALSSFPGLEHRLQFVAECDGVRYFNDSKCTTPQAAQLALESFNPGVVHIILGGYDKGANIKSLADLAANHCRHIYTIGATGNTIAGLAGDKAVRCETLEIAMSHIHQCVKPGDVVLLSPGCASWDQFDNYQQRGHAFTALVPDA